MPLAADPSPIDEPVPPDVAGADPTAPPAPAAPDVAASTTLDSSAGAEVVTSAPAVPVVPGTPSWMTGEFYAAIAPLVAGLATVVTGRHLVAADIQEWLVGAGTVVVGMFALARIVLKATHVHAAATVARAQAIAAAQASRSTPTSLDAVAAVAARHAVDPAALAAAIGDEIDRRFVLRHRPTRKAR